MAISPTSFQITWNNGTGTQPINNIVQYKRTVDPTFLDNPIGPTTGSLQLLNGLIPGTQYDIRVKAQNTAGIAFSSVVQATTGGISTSPVIITGSQTFIDSFGITWGISAGLAVYNGTSDTTTSNIIEMALIGGNQIWQENGSGQWYSKPASASPVNGGWTLGSDPFAPPSTPGVMIYNPGDTLPSVGSSGSSVVVNMTTQLSAVVNKAMWGMATASIAAGATGANWPPVLLDDATFRSQVAGLGLRFVRMHTWTLMSNIFGGGGISSNVSTSSPNYSLMSPFTAANFNSAFPSIGAGTHAAPAELMMNIIYGGYEGYNYGTQANTLAQCYALFAQRMESQGVFIKYWSPCNENNGQGFSAASVAQLLAAVKPALKAVNPNYLVGGGDFTGPETGYISAMAGAGAEFANWHGYFESVQEFNDDFCLNTKGVEFAAMPHAGNPSPLTAFRSQQPAANPLMLNTEWNFNFAGGGDTRQRTFFGAVFHALVRCDGVYGGYAGMAHWHIEDPDGNYPIFTPGPSFSYYPSAWLIKALNQYMPAGNARSVTLNFSGGSGRLSSVCSSDGTNFGLLIINRNTGNSGGNDGSAAGVTWNGSVTLNGRVSSANLVKWQMDRFNTSGVTTNITQASLSSVSIPGPGIVILSGAV